MAALLNACQAAVGGYALYFSVISIVKLQKYEGQAKTAAKYSNIAGEQLQKTRTTQGAGAVAVVFSLASSFYLVYRSLAYSSASGSSLSTPILLSAANAAASYFAQWHISGFWENRPKVPLPGVGDYNDAISTTERVRLCLRILTASWVAELALGGFGLIA